MKQLKINALICVSGVLSFILPQFLCAATKRSVAKKNTDIHTYQLNTKRPKTAAPAAKSKSKPKTAPENQTKFPTTQAQEYMFSMVVMVLSGLQPYLPAEELEESAITIFQSLLPTICTRYDFSQTALMKEMAGEVIVTTFITLVENNAYKKTYEKTSNHELSEAVATSLRNQLILMAHHKILDIQTLAGFLGKRLDEKIDYEITQLQPAIAHSDSQNNLDVSADQPA